MNRLPYVLLALALVGIADAGYDSYAVYTGQALWCPPPIDGCNIVASSPYARVFGIPLGYLGTVYYVGMAIMAALLASSPFSRLRGAIVLGYAGFGLFGSAVFVYIQRSYIHAFCIYCAVSAVLTVLLSATAWKHYRKTRPAPGVRAPSPNQMKVTRTLAR
jgi:uncharacterized membrane protein